MHFVTYKSLRTFALEKNSVYSVPLWLYRDALGALKHLHLEMECRILLIEIFGFGFYRMLVVLLER